MDDHGFFDYMVFEKTSGSGGGGGGNGVCFFIIKAIILFGLIYFLCELFGG